MAASNSIRVRLSRSYFVFFMLVILLGGISVGMISYENSVSSEIRDRWLQNTMLIGDFENFTSDYRSDEGSLLLTTNTGGMSAEEVEMGRLDNSVLQTQLKFERIVHDADETRLYSMFLGQWVTYKAAQAHVFSVYRTGDKSLARTLFQTESRDAYQTVSTNLENLRRYNSKEVSLASTRSQIINYNVLWMIGLAVVITDILAFAASVHVRRSIFNPLIELIAAMRLLARNKTDIQAEGLNRSDEIGEMARAVMLFKDNIIALDENQRQLEQQALILQESLAAEQELTLHQRNFVSMVSHEFRTPLNVIDGQAQRLLRHKTNLDATEIETRTAAIRGAVLRMTNMIDQLLEVTRLIDGNQQLYLQTTTFDIKTMLHDVCQQHLEIAPYVNLHEKWDGQPLIYRGDQKLLFQAFSNIVGNSIKYSAKDVAINVEISTDFGGIIIDFSDNGMGIPADDIPKLFNRYFRGGNVSGVVGTGLGLYIVKTIIDLHGGNIIIESEMGKGTKTSIHLPALAGQEKAAN